MSTYQFKNGIFVTISYFLIYQFLLIFYSSQFFYIFYEANNKEQLNIFLPH